MSRMAVHDRQVWVDDFPMGALDITNHWQWNFWNGVGSCSRYFATQHDDAFTDIRSACYWSSLEFLPFLWMHILYMLPVH